MSLLSVYGAGSQRRFRRQRGGTCGARCHLRATFVRGGGGGALHQHQHIYLRDEGHFSCSETLQFRVCRGGPWESPGLPPGSPRGSPGNPPGNPRESPGISGNPLGSRRGCPRRHRRGAAGRRPGVRRQFWHAQRRRRREAVQENPPGGPPGPPWEFQGSRCPRRDVAGAVVGSRSGVVPGTVQLPPDPPSRPSPPGCPPGSRRGEFQA